MPQQPIPETAAWRMRLRSFVEHRRFAQTVTVLIVINAALLGLETAPVLMGGWDALIGDADVVILGIFTIEIALRIAAHGRAFWRDPWSVFDFVIVAISLAAIGNPLSVLRALRVLRVLHLISVVPRLRRVVQTLLHSLPGIGSIVLLLVLLIYVSSVMATELFGREFPQWFGTVGQSMYSLFQIMTLESWSMGIVRPVMEAHPLAWMFFVPFVLIVGFAVLNLFIAVVVDSMQQLHREERSSAERAAEQEARAEREALRADIRRLHEEIAALRSGPRTE